MIRISVRFVLVLSQIAGLEIQAIDFVVAFYQADLDALVYMELPSTMELPPSFGHPKPKLLLMKKSLHGLKQVSLN